MKRRGCPPLPKTLYDQALEQVLRGAYETPDGNRGTSRRNSCGFKGVTGRS